MIYVTGDVHGSQDKWLREIHPYLKDGDKIIICGDFGIGFFNKKRMDEETFLDFLSEQRYEVLFIDGNHENFNKLNNYEIINKYEGKMHKVRLNVYHLMRGEVYNIDGKSVFTLGGGYSYDKEFRVENVNWWQEELPSEEEYLNAFNNLKRVNNKVDFIITHSAPSETIYYLSLIRSLHIKNKVSDEYYLNTRLDEIVRTVEYKYYYFGHFHVDYEAWRSQIGIFSSIRELETSKIIHSWIPYDG